MWDLQWGVAGDSFDAVVQGRTRPRSPAGGSLQSSLAITVCRVPGAILENILSRGGARTWTPRGLPGVLLLHRGSAAGWPPLLAAGS